MRSSQPGRLEDDVVRLRLWPGLAAAALFVLSRFALPVIVPDAGLAAMLVSVIATVLIMVWWVFFSRAPWADRIGGLLLLVAAIVAIRPLLHVSIRGAGMGNLYYVFAAQLAALLLVMAALAARSMATGARRAVVATAIVAGVAFWTLIRTDGVISTNLLGGLYHWRWTPTAEQQLLAATPDVTATLAPPPPPVSTPPPVQEPDAAALPGADVPAASTAESGETPAVTNATPAPAPMAPAGPSWPGFRGAARDGVVRGVSIDTRWDVAPPVEIWRRKVGPGWSSFAVSGGRLYTQEQRGEDEIVASYDVATGEPVWMHSDAVRFYESNGGAGPRATPTLDGGRVYAFGATGILNALDAATGAREWSRNVSRDVDRAVPGWGFSSSPLVVDGLVIVAASGTLAAYDAATGTPRWTGPREPGSYSSPQLLKAGGVDHVVLLTGAGAIALRASDGALLWRHDWEGVGAPIVQPAVLGASDVLTTSSAMTGGNGLRRLAIAKTGDAWTAVERWTSNGLKPYFNDYVLHEGHAYGFDGNILSSIDLADGRRNWKGGRYGNGQLVLLADQDLLLVISEDGELALVGATPAGYTEHARVPALNGKTWNHPVVVGDVLLLRNGEEMAAFRLPRPNR